MGYLPSFLPTEIFVSPNGTSAFGVARNDFFPFSQSPSNNLGDSSVLNTTSNPSQPRRRGLTPTTLVGTNPNDNSSNVGGGGNGNGNGNSGGNGNDNTQMSDGFCPAVYFPVCANGQTFSNSCMAQKAGFTQFTQGECATNNGGDNGNGGVDGGGGGGSMTDPETGCLIQGFDVIGNPIFIDANGNPTINPVGCIKGGDKGSGDVDNGNGGVGGGGGSIPDDEKIIAFVKKNWIYLLAVTAGIYLLTNKSN